MRFSPTRLDGAWIIDIDRHVDERGSFARTYCEREHADHGLPTCFPQCILSSNTRACTLRGLHLNVPAAGESKLVHCVRVAIHDAIVDLRPASPTYIEWLGVELTAEAGRALFVPEGFAHGFVTLADDTDVWYQMGTFYKPDAARGVRWDDPAFGIEWPLRPSLIAHRDATYPDFDSSIGVV